MKNIIDKIGGFGAVFAAAACPICFPKLAAIGAIFGLGALVTFEVYFFWAAQFLVMLTLVGQYMVFQRLRNITLLLSSIIFALLFFISLYVVISETLSYIALSGIIIGSIWMMREERKNKAVLECPGDGGSLINQIKPPR